VKAPTYAIHCRDDGTVILKLEDLEMRFSDVVKAIDFLAALPDRTSNEVVLYDSRGNEIARDSIA